MLQKLITIFIFLLLATPTFAAKIVIPDGFEFVQMLGSAAADHRKGLVIKSKSPLHSCAYGHYVNNITFRSKKVTWLLVLVIEEGANCTPPKFPETIEQR